MFINQYKPWLNRVSTLMKSELRTEIPYVRQLVDYQTASSGKMLRPILVLLSARLAGTDNVDTIRAAAAIELMHNATLLHDDVVDQSLVRHNRKTVNAVWSDKAAVLLGDYLLAEALCLMTKTRSLAMLDSLMRCGSQLAEGELYQQKQSHELLADEQRYYDIIGRKTASLFASCAYCGALSAGADEEFALRIEKIGREIGLLFQMRDDILDYEPQNAAQIAKPVLHDIYEGKITLPLLLAIHNATASDKAQVFEMIRKMSEQGAPAPANTDNYKFSKEQESVLNFVIENHGIETAWETIERKKNAMKAELNTLDGSDALIALLDFAVERNS